MWKQSQIPPKYVKSNAKSQIFRESIPRTPLVCRMQSTSISLRPSSHSPIISHLPPPLGQKTESNHSVVVKRSISIIIISICEDLYAWFNIIHKFMNLLNMDVVTNPTSLGVTCHSALNKWYGCKERRHIGRETNS